MCICLGHLGIFIPNAKFLCLTMCLGGKCTDDDNVRWTRHDCLRLFGYKMSQKQNEIKSSFLTEASLIAKLQKNMLLLCKSNMQIRSPLCMLCNIQGRRKTGELNQALMRKWPVT